MPDSLAIGFVALKEGKNLNRAQARELIRRGYRMSIVRAYVARLGEERRAYVEASLDELTEAAE